MSNTNEIQGNSTPLPAAQTIQQKIYDYPQEPSFVPGSFSKEIDPILKEILDARHVLQMYTHIQRQNAHDKTIHDPAAYNSTVDNKAYAMALNEKYQPIYNEVYEKLKNENYPVHQFMKMYEAFIATSADNSGVENGFVYNYFLEQELQNGIWNQYNLYFLNPSPTLIERMANETTLKHKTTLYFTDKLYAHAYKFDLSLMSFRINDKSNIELSSNSNRILIFGDTMSPAELGDQLAYLKTKTRSLKSVIIYLYCPNTYIDGNEGRQTLHAFISDEMVIDSVSIIDDKAFCDKKRKHSLLKLRFISGEDVSSTIPFQEVRFFVTENGKKLIPQEWVSVSKNLFVENKKTITTLFQSSKLLNTSYQSETNETNATNESNTVEIIFSDEIKGTGTVELTASGKYRLALNIKQRPTPRQKRENRFGQGSSLGRPVKGKSKGSPEEAINSAYEILFDNNDLRTKICEMINNEYPDQEELSLKTFWYLHLDELNKPGYDHNRAIRMFCINNDLDIGAKKISLFTEGDIEAYIQHMVNAEVNDEPIKKAIKILDLIFSLRGKECINPCQDMLSNLNHTIQQHKEFRHSHIRRSFNVNEIRKLYSLFERDLRTSLKGKALGGIIKMFTGMDETEICALIREDIIYEKEQDLYTFNVTHECAFNSSRREELTTGNYKRRIPICNQLQKLVPLSFDSNSKNNPIVHNTHGNAITPKELKDYISTKIKELNVEKVFLPIPGKNPVNINDYRGDWIRSNFDYAMRTIRKILPDDLNYIMGRNLQTTDGKHYRDYLCVLRQLAICAKIDGWAESVVGNTLLSDKKTDLKIETIKQEYAFTGCVTPNIDIIEIQTPCDTADGILNIQILQRFSGNIIIEEME